MSQPRVTPLKPDEQTEEQQEVLGRVASGGNANNLFATVGRHPQLLKRWASFGNSLLRHGELAPRDREILVLRTARNCSADYPFGQHELATRRLGLSDEERAPIVGTEPAADPDDQMLIDAADDLHRDAKLSDATWKRLADRYTQAQLIELVFVVGQYHLVSFLANSLEIEPEAGLARVPR